MKLMQFVPKTNQLIGEHGATLTNYFITSPICCPSRTSMLRGQYSHNTDILENAPGFVRFFKLKEEAETLPVWLSDAGYQTALIGKYLNAYPTNAGKNYVPPGWSEWNSFIYQQGDNDFYYTYILNENGKLVEYGDAPEDYSTDVIKEKSINFINKNTKEDSPFFLLITAYGAHGPSTPAPRHENLFLNETYPQTPSFHEQDTSDKPQIIQDLANTGDEFDVGDANSLFIKRIQSMQSVDDLVEEVIQTLEKNNQLENTYIIFTSDNGFHMGEHNVPSGKGMPYEEDIHVPFLIRGPGIEAKSQISQMILNIDLAPTIVDLTNASQPDFIDGQSFASFIHTDTDSATEEWRKGFLIEMGYNDAISSNIQTVAFLNSPPVSEFEYPDSKYDNYLAEVDGGDFRGIRTENFVYIEYANGEIELYDLINDPYQLENIANITNPEILAELHSHLLKLKTCSSADCQKYELELPNTLNLK